MNEPYNGGSAFPRDELRQGADDSIYQQHEGATLRDYFAAKALQAIIRNETTSTTPDACAVDSKWAYQYADAMLAERQCAPSPVPASSPSGEQEGGQESTGKDGAR